MSSTSSLIAEAAQAQPADGEALARSISKL
jgi:hypothetical protein